MTTSPQMSAYTYLSVDVRVLDRPVDGIDDRGRGRMCADIFGSWWKRHLRESKLGLKLIKSTFISKYASDDVVGASWSLGGGERKSTRDVTYCDIWTTSSDPCFARAQPARISER